MKENKTDDPSTFDSTTIDSHMELEQLNEFKDSKNNVKKNNTANILKQDVLYI